MGIFEILIIGVLLITFRKHGFRGLFKVAFVILFLIVGLVVFGFFLMIGVPAILLCHGGVCSY